MLIGLCGPACSGKYSIAQYLVTELGFVSIRRPSQLSETGKQPKSGTSDRWEQITHLSQNLTSQCWKSNINLVIQEVSPSDEGINDLLKRPYFLLVYVDAPLLARFKRAVELDRISKEDLEGFVRVDDKLKYSCDEGAKCGLTIGFRDKCYALSTLESLSRLRVLNNYDSLSDLYQALRSIDFTDTERLRPGWDNYFMSLAKLAAERTNCMKRRVGCVIARDKRMVATGYNGTPSGVRNCSEGGCGRCNGANNSQGVGLDLCLCLHAEENAIIEAGRERCTGSTLYTNLFPCILCSKKIVQSGIARVVFDKHYATDEAAQSLLRAGSVVVDMFSRKPDFICPELP